jgi:hypothetical protein
MELNVQLRNFQNCETSGEFYITVITPNKINDKHNSVFPSDDKYSNTA